jgi:hypothetical protein
MSTPTLARPAARVTVADVAKGDRVFLNGAWPQVTNVRQPFIGGRITLTTERGTLPAMTPSAAILVKHADAAPATEPTPAPERPDVDEQAPQVRATDDPAYDEAEQQAAEQSAAAAVPALPQVGDTVITRFDKKPVTWDGPSDSGWTSLSFGIGSGEAPKRKCSVEDVAPADTPLADAKDPRIVVEKANARAYGVYDTKPQAYRVTLPNGNHAWESLKRDAVETARRAFAIADWHAARSLQA